MSKHYNCAWCGTSLGYHAHAWAAIQGRDYCPRCQKPLWTDDGNRITPQVFVARPAVHRLTPGGEHWSEAV